MTHPRPALRLHSGSAGAESLAEHVRAMVARDQRGLTALYDLCARQVFGLALRIVADRHAAEDVVVDTFAEVWERAAGYHAGKGSVLAWVLAIARSRALDRRRRLGRSPTARAEIADLASAVFSREGGPDATLIGEERAARVRAAAAALPRGQREALAAAFFAGLTHNEIATAFVVPLGTVKSRIRDGLTALRRALAPAQEEHP